MRDMPDFSDDGVTLREAEPIVATLTAEAREQRHRRGVRFDGARRLIDVSGYVLDLDRAQTSAELLDWILQIGFQGYPQRLHDVLDELDDACQSVFGTRVQGVYCPSGEPRVVNWRRGTTRAG